VNITKHIKLMTLKVFLYMIIPSLIFHSVNLEDYNFCFILLNKTQCFSHSKISVGKSGYKTGENT